MGTVESMNLPLSVIAGGSSAAGVAVARALLAAGQRVITVGSDASRIREAARLTDGAIALSCNLADADAVAALAAGIHRDHGPVDGLIHLVGGWRGGEGLAGQSDADWAVLHESVLTTLRNTSRAFYAELSASPTGRLAIVSSTTVTEPTADNANYAAIKAAAETWVRATAAGFSADARRREAPETAAAVVLVVKALVDDAMRQRSPERRFPGFTDVTVLADAVAGLFSHDAAAVNGSRQILSHNP